MPRAQLPDNEDQRLAAIKELELDAQTIDPGLNSVVELVSLVCKTPIAIVSIVEQERQWFPAKVGLEAPETSREVSFCAHAILDPYEVLVVEDATQDERFADNALVTNDPSIRFYAGCPLITSSGYPVGSLCAIHNQPQALDKEQKAALEHLGRLVVQILERKKLLNQLEERQRYLEMAEDICSIGHWRVDLKNDHVFWSPGIYKIHGVTPEIYQPNLASALDFYHPADRPKVDAHLKQVIEEKQPFEFSLRLIQPDGTERQVTSKGDCECDQDGNVTALFGVFTDKTEQNT